MMSFLNKNDVIMRSCRIQYYGQVYIHVLCIYFVVLGATLFLGASPWMIAATFQLFTHHTSQSA